MKEKTLVSTFTLIGSLASYYYSKSHAKDVVPYVMIGGFIGAWVGEIISNVVIKKDNDKN
ncbi:MAG: hypothetical protein H0U95_04980 [Bacteroidetes bacterium]|nr:hypothetical protein [Bacteroidota bacterium]